LSRKNNLSHFGRSQRGAVTIEFVLTIPLFLVALAFAFEFGQFFLAHQSTVNNVRAAARYLARADVTTPQKRTLARANANDIIRTGQIGGANPPGYLASACTSDPCITLTGSTVRVDVLVVYPLQFFTLVDGGDRTGIPIRVREDLRRAGM